MFDKDLVRGILTQIEEAIVEVLARTRNVKDASFFYSSPAGKEKLDSVCMLLIAIGESLKNVDKITAGLLLPKYPDIDWSGAKKLRDIIAHHYFDIDEEQIFWIVEHELQPLVIAVQKIIKEISCHSI